MTTQTTAERLQRALEEYPPIGCKIVLAESPDNVTFHFGIGVAYNISSRIAMGRLPDNSVATIAAVAAEWFKAKRDAELRNNPEHIITSDWYRCNRAAGVYQSIYESATEVA